MVGTYVLGAVAILVSIFAVALHWPWPWWVWVLISAPCVVSGILMIWRDGKSSELRSPDTEKGSVTAAGDRSVALNTNYGIVSTGDDTTIER
jgi:membrane protein implicated in regulation of membrane protease activity